MVGCGYVGLPLGQAFADVGFNVTGIDNDPSRVEAMNAGDSHILDVPASQLHANVESGRFRATSDYSAVRGVWVLDRGSWTRRKRSL